LVNPKGGRFVTGGKFDSPKGGKFVGGGRFVTGCPWLQKAMAISKPKPEFKQMDLIFIFILPLLFVQHEPCLNKNP